MQDASKKQQLRGFVERQRAVTSDIVKRLRTFGPYLFIELLLPGGTLVSLLLLLYRRGGAGLDPALNDGALRPVVVVTRIAAGLKSFWC